MNQNCTVTTFIYSEPRGFTSQCCVARPYVYSTVFWRGNVSCACHIPKKVLHSHSASTSFLSVVDSYSCLLINLCLLFKFFRKKCGMYRNKIFCCVLRFHASLHYLLFYHAIFLKFRIPISCFSSQLQHTYPQPPLNEYSTLILNRNIHEFHNFTSYGMRKKLCVVIYTTHQSKTDFLAFSHTRKII